MPICVICADEFEPGATVGRHRVKCYGCSPSRTNRELEQQRLMRRAIKILIKAYRQKAREEQQRQQQIAAMREQNRSRRFTGSNRERARLEAQEALARDPRALCACERDYLSLPLRHECLSPLPNPAVRDHDRYRHLFIGD